MKYDLTFFSSDAVGKTYKLRIRKVFLILFFTLFIFTYLAIGYCLYAGFTIRKDIKELNAFEPSYQIALSEAIPYINKLNQAAVRIGDSDRYVKEIFQIPCVVEYFEQDKYIKSYLDSGRLLSLLHYDIKGAVDTLHLKRFTALLSDEYDKRLANSKLMLDHLNEQYLIFQHTPSIWPTTERITSPFGFRRNPFSGVPTFHEGVDFGAITGTPVKTTANGVIVFAGLRTGYGYLVTVDHGFGYMTRYAHNSRLIVKSGDFVKKGDVIALSGSTGRSAGPHLHYEVLYNGTPVNSVKFIPNEGRK